MKSLLNFLALILFSSLLITSCGDDDETTTGSDSNFAGAVYAMSNGAGQVEGTAVQGSNSIVAYGRNQDGTLDLIDEFDTGGNGGDFDGGEGLDPLISAYALSKTADNNFLLAVNAGSNTITSFTIQDDFSLEQSNVQTTNGVGPNSIAHIERSIDGVNGLVYVTNISRPEFADAGEPAQQGSIMGYWLMDDGNLAPIAGSLRELANRPSAVQFSPDGNFLVVASINSGSSALASDDQNEIVVYGVNADGTLSNQILDGATSTLRDNADGRNLPSAIGFQIVGDNYVVVTEAREFRPDGTPPVFPGLQDGSVSTWRITDAGTLEAINLDIASGENNTGRTACWIDFNEDESVFFVSNAIEAGLAAYSFDNGNIQLLDQTAAQGVGATGNTTDPAAAFGTTEGWIDMWISDDGNYLYQLHGYRGTIGVYEVDGENLRFIENVSGNLPQNNVQGIVAI
jgi:6-phosphogluconolactonase (cycloisomerase 2 family)